MTRPKAKTLGPSGPGALVWWGGDLVPSLPELSQCLTDERGRSVADPAEFASWLEAPLADYRAHVRARESMAEKAAVIRWLERAAAEPAAALADGRLHRLPVWFAEPAVFVASHKLAVDWPAAVHSGSLNALAQVLAEAAAALRRERVRRGRPSLQARDSLLSAIVARLRALGLGAEDAQHRADLILTTCRVPSPEASVARAVRRGGRGAISV